MKRRGEIIFKLMERNFTLPPCRSLSLGNNQRLGCGFWRPSRMASCFTQRGWGRGGFDLLTLRTITFILLACLLTPHANAARLGRIFFTPQQRSDLDHSNARNASVGGNDSSVLTVNGIVQKRGGPRTVWINGVPQKAGQSDERSPDALSVDLPGKSQRVKIKVGQKLHLDQPLPPNSQSPDN